MAKKLKIKFPKKCTGCELCVFETQHQLKKIGYEGALIRILTNEHLEISIDMDPRVQDLDVKKIAEICPTGVFEIEESN